MVYRNDGKIIELKYEIRHHGNWNLKRPELPAVKTKPMGVIFLGLENYVFKHKELLQLIEAYILADDIAIEMIEHKEVDTGHVKVAEISLRDKIKYFIERRKKC